MYIGLGVNIHTSNGKGNFVQRVEDTTIKIWNDLTGMSWNDFTSLTWNDLG